MHYAKLQSDFSYWQKQTSPLFGDLLWNIPEQKSSTVTVLGGNSQNFATVVKVSEFLQQTYPLKRVTTLLPDSLRGKLPPLPDLEFSASTASGSFAASAKIDDVMASSDGVLFIGDLSRNSATAIALSDSLHRVLNPTAHSATSPQSVILTRDSIDLLAADAERWLNFPQITLVASLVQLQKIFRAVYYPKMIMLSQPLIPTLETLHKFTLTYPVTLLTFHQENIITAQNGKIITTPIVDTSYSPIALWAGQLAARILTLELYNPGHHLEAATAAILS